MIEFVSPTLDYALLAPILIVLGGAVLGVLIEAFAPRKSRASSQLFITLVTLVLSLVSLIRVRDRSSSAAAMESVTFDGAGMLIQGSILIISIISVFLLADQENFTALAAALPGSDEERASLQQDLRVTEIYPLTLFAVAGMMLFPVATDLITLFVALEVLSLPLYLLAGLSRRRRLMSQEAALKYFLLGAFASAFFLMGIAYLYGYSSSVTFAGIHSAVIGGSGNDIYLLLGIAFISIGLLFKVGAVPFHAWSPDVYQGAPTAVTALMAAATKVAAFGAMLRIFYVSFAEAYWQLSKSGLESSIFYLFAYGIATVGAFGVVTLVRDSAGEVTDLNRWSGLGKRSPWVATAFAGFLLAFAGIPLTSGFIGKFSIFSAAYESGSTAILITGVLSSAIAAFFYIRVIVLMFFKDPVADGTSVVIPSIYTQITITVSAVATFALGIYPTPLINFIQSSAAFLR